MCEPRLIRNGSDPKSGNPLRRTSSPTEPRSGHNLIRSVSGSRANRNCVIAALIVVLKNMPSVCRAAQAMSNREMVSQVSMTIEPPAEPAPRRSCRQVAAALTVRRRLATGQSRHGVHLLEDWLRTCGGGHRQLPQPRTPPPQLLGNAPLTAKYSIHSPIDPTARVTTTRETGGQRSVANRSPFIGR